MRQKCLQQKTTVTKFCSDICAKANYKQRQKEHKIELSQIDTEKQLVQIKSQRTKSLLGGYADSEMVSISGLAKMIGLSERTIFRLIERTPVFQK